MYTEYTVKYIKDIKDWRKRLFQTANKHSNCYCVWYCMLWKMFLQYLNYECPYDSNSLNSGVKQILVLVCLPGLLPLNITKHSLCNIYHYSLYWHFWCNNDRCKRNSWGMMALCSYLWSFRFCELIWLLQWKQVTGTVPWFIWKWFIL